MRMPPGRALSDASMGAPAVTPGGPATLQSAVATLADSGSAALAGAASSPASVAPAGHDLAGPAAIDPPAAIEILNEGGLMDGKEYAGRRISLDFKEVEVADVL